MADDTLDVIEPFDFHPCNSPRGMLYYDIRDLTNDQQIELNKFKRNSVRENEKYLASHPEIRALIALTSRYVFLHRPRTDLPQFIGRFFLRPKLDIEKEVEDYISSRDPHVYEGDSAVGLNLQYQKEKSLSVVLPEEEEQDIGKIPKELLDEIIERALIHLEARDWRSFDDDEKAVIIKSVVSDILNKALDERQKVVSYLFKSHQDLGDYESTMATLDDLTIATTDILTPSSDSDTDVKNVTEIELNERKIEIDQDQSEATDMAGSSQEIIELFEEQSQEIVEQPPEIVEQSQAVVEEIVEKSQATEAPPENETPVAEEAT